MSFIVVIPARYSSSRLPGKPLLEIAGKPMLAHVVERARQSEASAVYVATDDERVLASCGELEVEAIMTSADHPSGTDRIEEVARIKNLDDSDIIVNVQGDEPLIPPAIINQVAGNMARYPDAGICTLYETIKAAEQLNDPNAVKVVTDLEGMALYFSRAPVPWLRDEYGRGEGVSEKHLQAGLFKRHIGIYAYRVGVLHQYVQWPVSPLERSEKLEQLRALENGVRIHADCSSEEIPSGVDTEDDLKFVREIIEIKS